MNDYDITILNTIRNSASSEYQSRIPSATQTNITNVGNSITTYTNFFNEFTGLLGKIGMTIVSSKMAENRLARFKKGMIDSTDIEEIFVRMATAEGEFDETGANPLGRRKPTILSKYHRENRRDKYVVSISMEQVQGAFKNSSGISNLLNDIVNSIYSADVYDEYVLMKQLLANYGGTNYVNYEVPLINETNGLETTAKTLIRTVRKAVTDLSFMSDKYNKAGVKTITPVESLVLLVHKDVIAHVDVDVLAKAFNLGKTDFEPTIVVLDDFGDMTDTYGLLVDKDFFMVFDTLYKTVEQFNGDGLFTNIFLHHWQTLSLSEFKNAVRFTTADVVAPV